MTETKEKIKCWVVYDEEWPKGLVFENRDDALDYSKESRDNDVKSYVRVKYFTRDGLKALDEAD